MTDTAFENIKERFEQALGRLNKPKKAVVTAGMPYANGPLHLGHLGGTQVPADIQARWLRMLIGDENVLFVCGTDDHGSNSEVAAKKLGKTTEEFIGEIHTGQKATMEKYGISLNIYTGTSRPSNFEDHKKICQDFLRTLYKNGRLEKKTSEQWYDPGLSMFLPDRYVTGECPNCDNKNAYSEECDACGAIYEPKALKNPVSSLSGSSPVLKETDHWYLDMWNACDQLVEWIESKKKTWRKVIMNEVLSQVMPTLTFSNKSEPDYKEIKESLPSHKSRYAPGKKVALAFTKLTDFEEGIKALRSKGIECEASDGWAFRSITRDVPWGIPVPHDVDETMKGKTFYVWPESLVAPLSFTREALKESGRDPEQYKDFWCDPESKVYQYIGQDNIFFYVLMQGSMWLGTQEDMKRLPIKGELQMTEVVANYHLHINGTKMSKSTGNFYTGDQLIDEMGYDPEQVRYFLSILSLSEKNSNFDEVTLKERNAFLAGPLNAAFEKPVSACHSKFGGVIPEGKLIGKTEKETVKILNNYLKMMERGENAKILFAIENYARVVNSLFSQFKPHDDRHDETERKDALYSCFYILKNIVIMLHPFAPKTIDRLRETLNLEKDIYNVENLATGIAGGHKINEQREYFPKVES